MEDTKSLLIMVLQKVFQDRPKIVEDTFQLIYNYNNGKREKMEYEKTLRTICDLMNEELPSQILVYLLTMVDMPTEDGSQLPIMEKMQKTHNCLPESVRPHLLEYLRTKRPAHIAPTNSASGSNNKAPPVAPPPVVIESAMETAAGDGGQCKSRECNLEEIELGPPAAAAPVEPETRTEPCIVDATVDENFQRPAKKCRLKKKPSKNASDESSADQPKPLQDLCTLFIVRNESYLKQLYDQKQEAAWNMLYGDVLKGRRDALQKCYTCIEDLNTKRKWLRMIEDNSVTADSLMEAFKGDLDMLYRIKQAACTDEEDRWVEDPFEVSRGVRDVIANLKLEFGIADDDEV